MAAFSAALALLSGAVGAGFASGREILHFFAAHGAMAGAAAVCALITMAGLFCRLPVQMERCGCTSLAALCRVRFGERLGRLCGALFFALFAVTGGAMLAACAELAALTVPVRGAYALGMAITLLLAAWLSLGEAGSLILGWSFLSMGLRGAVAFVPMCFALFVKKPIPRPFVVAAMIAGPALVIAGQYMLPAHIDPLFLGIAGTLVICAAGLIRRNNHV